MIPAFISPFRFVVLFAAVVFCFIGIQVRLYFLHVVDRDQLVQIIEENRRQLAVHASRRGNIVDRQGNILATSRTFVELGVDPQMVREEDEAKWPRLATLLEMPLSELEAHLRRKVAPGSSAYAENVRLIRWQKLHDGLNESTYQEILDVGIRGVYGNRTFRRVYPARELAAHILGFTNREGAAVMGVERSLDFYLRGEDGWRVSERDGRRQELAQFRSREVKPSDGLNVQLTLDMMVQHLIEEELREIVREFDPKGATVIVTEPASGYVLGLANYPSFDLNEYNLADIAHHRNLAITDVLEPGSTFKIVAVGAALNEGIVDPDQIFDCSLRTLNIRGRQVRLPRDHRNFGDLTVREILSNSSNIGVAQLGVLLGSNRLYNYARDFGFGSHTGFPLPGEVRGTLHEVRNWDGLTITRLPMGHAVNATPLQIHYAMGAIANQGVLMEPRIVRSVFDNHGEQVFSQFPRARHRVLSPSVARTVAEILVDAVDGGQGQGGTARRAEIPGFEVAGKTGTTQKIINGRYSNRHHVASFTGFFPASDPRVVITVVVDEPTLHGSGYGGLVAAPSFKRIGEQLIPYLGIRPAENNEPFMALQGGPYDRVR